MAEVLTQKEEINVFLWRTERFKEMGFPEEEAELLAVSDADVAVAKRMLTQGCPLELALQILL